MNYFISIAITIINYIIKCLGEIVSLVFILLPPSPFKILDNSPIAKYLPTLNYFIPISEIVLSAEIWLVAIGLYYIYQIALRWLKVIE